MSEQQTIEYTPEQLAAARQLVEFDRAKAAAELTARRTAYREAVSGLIGGPEWAAVRTGLTKIVSETEADGMLSFHVSAIVEIMGRLDKAISGKSSG